MVETRGSESIEQAVVIALPHFPGGVRPARAGRAHARDNDGPPLYAQLHFLGQARLRNERLGQPDTAPCLHA